ncbi:unnamed protein product [Calypogeia fissa]
MTKELVRDVGVKGRDIPKGLEGPPIDEAAKMKGVGTSNPHPVGLPSLAAAAAQVAAQDLATQGAKKGTPKGTPKRTPQKASGRPQRRVTIQAGRAASPPQSSARESKEDGDLQVIDGVKAPVEVHKVDSDTNLRLVKITRVDSEIVATAQ